MPYQPDPHPSHPTPRYVAVSATRSGVHGVQYRVTTQERDGSHLLHEGLGGGDPTCGHLHCALANLAVVTAEYAAMLRSEIDAPVDLDQLYLDLG